jgi:peptidoglycan/xylan/chitin deacetylase (PgdA/CDA1 family)
LFRKQLRELRAAGWTTTSLDKFGAEKASVANQCAITFDDGFTNVLQYGLEPLRQAGFTAIQFVVSDRIGQGNVWDIPAGEVPERLMDATQIREWMAAGHQVGSHSATHPRLTQLSPEAAFEEISGSRKRLEDLFGVPIRHFCYPYGDWNLWVREQVQNAGYATACTTEFGVNRPPDSPHSLKRVTARYRSRSLRALWSWLRGAA